MNSWEQRGRARQNHHVRSSSGSRQAEVMCSHEDTCYSRLKSDPKRGTDWYKLHRSAPSQHLCRYRCLQVVQQWVSETWVVQTKDSLYNNCIEKTFTFPKPSTQALLLCDVHRLTEENKKTSLWTSQVNKGRNRVQESRTASSWQVAGQRTNIKITGEIQGLGEKNQHTHTKKTPPQTPSQNKPTYSLLWNPYLFHAQELYYQFFNFCPFPLHFGITALTKSLLGSCPQPSLTLPV